MGPKYADPYPRRNKPSTHEIAPSSSVGHKWPPCLSRWWRKEQKQFHKYPHWLILCQLAIYGVHITIFFAILFRSITPLLLKLKCLHSYKPSSVIQMSPVQKKMNWHGGVYFFPFWQIHSTPMASQLHPKMQKPPNTISLIQTVPPCVLHETELPSHSSNDSYVQWNPHISNRYQPKKPPPPQKKNIFSPYNTRRPARFCPIRRNQLDNN